MKAVRFVIVSLGSLFGIIYLLYVAYFYFNQQEMVFRASALPQNHEFTFAQPFEEVRISSFDRNQLHGLLFTTSPSKGLIFYLHGNAGNVDNWGSNAKLYTDLGYDVFFLDYRGFGKSRGSIEDEAQVFQDVLVAYDKLHTRYKNKKTLVIGYSIGTGLATYLAWKRNPDGLLLQAPFYNFLEYTDGRAPYFPDFLKKFPFETNRYISRLKCPVYLFHGDKDGLIPLSESQRLSQVISSPHQLFVLEGEDHIGLNDNPDYQRQLQLILQ